MVESNAQVSTFEELLLRKQDKVGLSLLLVLAWISASDGSIDEQEKRDINAIAKAGGNSECVSLIISIAKRSDIRSIQLACEIVHTAFKGEKAKLLIELAIGIAISDRYLLPSENYILRFLSDLLGISPSTLDEEFKRITGKPLPEAPDVSSHDYWYEKERRNQSQRERSQQQRSQRASSDSSTSTPVAHKHYATLGLEPEATQVEIKSAYKRLAKVHHPDRFESLGKEAVEAAHVTFQRIQEAYSYLSKYA